MSTSQDSPRTLPFAIMDVFAERPLEGNALAVFTDARGLSTHQMQSIARETNLSETTFLIPREPHIEDQHGVEVRIFTTQEELPFAGHPTLGTAAWIHLNHPTLRGRQNITLELKVGPIQVTFKESQGPGVFGTMQQNAPAFGQVHPREEVASILGLTLADLDPHLPVQTVSTGLPFCIVPLRSLDVSRRLAIPPAAAASYLAGTDAKFFYCICPADPASGADWHARMQFYNGEDPATGSASGCAIAFLVANAVVPGGQPIILEQGVEIGRPSRLHVRALMPEASPAEIYVGGRTIHTATGSLFL